MKTANQEGEEGFDAEAVYSNRNDVSSLFMALSNTEVAGLPAINAAWGDHMQAIDDATRLAISRVTNIIRVFAAHFVPLTDALLVEAYGWAVEQDGDAKSLMQDEVSEALVVAITARA